MLDNLERGRARPWPRSPGPARPAMPTACAGRGGGSWNGRSASAGCPGPPPCAACRRHPSARRVSDRESGLRLPPGLVGPGPSLRPRGTRPPRAGRPVLPRPLVARQQGPAGLPGLLHQHGPARLRRAQLRPLRPGGAGRLIARPPPHRGAASRGREQGFAEYETRWPWSTCSPGRRSMPGGSGSPGRRGAATTPGSPRRSTTGSRRPSRWWAPANSPSRSASAGRSTGTTRQSTATSSPA